jgi:DNA-binding XRE family transcriptional regulator
VGKVFGDEWKNASFRPERIQLRPFPFMFHQLTNLQIEQEHGHRLKQRRLELMLSQSEVPGRSGLSRRTITAIENGEGSTLGTFIALLRAL